jgi:hypothetical protein
MGCGRTLTVDLLIQPLTILVGLAQSAVQIDAHDPISLSQGLAQEDLIVAGGCQRIR